MVYYDASKDQSEKFGWKKVCDEYIPFEEEQTAGSIRIILLAAGFGLILFLGKSHGIF